MQIWILPLSVGSRGSINICLATNLWYVLTTSHYNIMISSQKHVPFQAWLWHAYNDGHQHLMHIAIKYDTNQARITPMQMYWVDYLCLNHHLLYYVLPGETVFLKDTLQTSPVDATQIRVWTNSDTLLACVINMVLKGWSNASKKDLKSYHFAKRS